MDSESPVAKQTLSGEGGPVCLPADYSEQIVASLSSGVIAVNSQGTIVAANSAAAHQLGISPEPIPVGARLIQIPALSSFAEILQEMLDTGQPVSRREIILSSASGTRVIGLTASLLRGTESFSGAAFLFTDLTRIRELERSAEINRQLAQIGELTAGVVHELRNPLSVISGMAELLVRKLSEDPALERRAQAIVHEAGQLEQLISQFLMFAKPFEIQAVRCNPDEIIQRAAQLCHRLAQERGVSIVLSSTDPAFWVEADAAKLAQAMSNLIRNAIEVQAPGGSVRVQGFLRADQAVMRIEDQGPGLPEGSGDDLFKPFVSKKAGGTGLGLSLVHRIVAAHGGQVGFGNLAERGAFFEICLPLEQPRKAQ